MVKQTTQICVCKQPMDFPDGEVRYTCQCGTVWELDNGGYWFSQLVIATKGARAPKVVSRAQKYVNFPNTKRRKKGRRGSSI